MRLLSVYLVSILIYMILYIGTVMGLQDKIMENGWLDDVSDCENPLLILFCTCAVPIVRIGLIVFVVYAATHTKEEFDAWMSKLDQEIEELDREIEEQEQEIEELKRIINYLKSNHEEE
jgi:predicted DNA-binding transcriptional regulator